MEQSKHTIQRLFMLNVLVLVAVFLALQGVLNVSQIRTSMEEQVRENLVSQAAAIVGRINQRFSSFRLKTEGFALAATSLPRYEEKPLHSMLITHIMSDTMIVGGGFWFAPYVFDPEKKLFCGYSDVDTEGTLRQEAGYTDGSYDYTRTEWFRKSSKRKGVVWSGPYRDEVTGVIMLTSSCGLWKDGKWEGCVTLDIGLEELEHYIHGVHIGKNGYAFLVQQDGRVIGTHEAEEFPDKITEISYPGLAELGRSVLSVSSVTVFEADIYGVNSYVIAAPLNVESMKLVLVAPKSDYTGIIYRYIMLTVAMVLLVATSLFFSIRSLFRSLIYRPIRKLVAASGEIAAGKTAEIHTGSQDELGYLAKSFSDMSKTLQKRNDMLSEQYRLLAEKNHALEVALANVEVMRASRDIYKIEAETDKLTGLLNKASTERLAKEMLEDLPEGKVAAFFILDLDHFKEANDTHGHQYGDLILQGFAGALRQSFRPTDIVGRFGGDEFVVLISELPGQEIAERKAHQILRKAHRLEIEGRNPGISASIGIAIAPARGRTYEELFQTADRSLYRVKEDGRDGYCINEGAPLHIT